MAYQNGSSSNSRLKPLAWFILSFIGVAIIVFALQQGGIIGGSGTTLGRIMPGSPEVPGDLLEISFYTSDAKKKWVEEMIKTFNAAGHKVGGRPIKVKAIHVLSGQSMDDIKAGIIQPDIWSPGDESWLELAAAHWRNVKQKPLFDKYTPLVNIPLVIAMWEPMARVLGYPGPIGWKDLEKVAANPQGWTAYGHPEWGKFRWGHAHPDANSGFLTVISAVYAAAGKTRGLSPEDLKRPKVVNFLHSLEGKVEHYGLSSGWIDELMHKKGPSYLSASVLYENTIIESNERNQNKPFKVVAIYPEEGCFWTRHPAAILKEDWMTPEKEEACRKFIDFLLSEEGQGKAVEFGLRPVANIPLGRPFDDDHGARAVVSAERAFEVPDESVLKRIRDLWEDVKVPATVIMVLDRSGSMKGVAMDNAKAGAVAFVKSMKARDELKVLVFNKWVSVLSEMATIKESSEQAIGKLEGLFAEGGTALYDAINTAYATLKELRAKNPHRRYCLIVLSDGLDTNSDMQWNDFLDTLPQSEDFDAPKIYTIAYGGEADKNVLTEISNRTNGKLFISNPEEIQKTYRELSANF